MSDGNVNTDIIDVLSVTLRVPANQINDDFSPAQCETWDSVRHLMIMLAIEEKFAITFDEKEITELMNLASIRKAVQTYVAKT